MDYLKEIKNIKSIIMKNAFIETQFMKLFLKIEELE